MLIRKQEADAGGNGLDGTLIGLGRRYQPQAPLTSRSVTDVLRHDRAAGRPER